MKNPTKSLQFAKSPRIFRKVALTLSESLENFHENFAVKDISTVELTVHGLCEVTKLLNKVTSSRHLHF